MKGRVVGEVDSETLLSFESSRADSPAIAANIELRRAFSRLDSSGPFLSRSVGSSCCVTRKGFFGEMS